MLKIAVAYSLVLSGVAYGILEFIPPLLNYYYMVLAAVGIYKGIQTDSGAYKWLVAIAGLVYGVENNPAIWHDIEDSQLAIMYFISGWVVLLLSRSDDGLKAAEFVAGIMALKWVVSCLYPGYFDSSYAYHSILNVLSITQWVIIITISMKRVNLNKGYSGDSPFMLRVLWVRRNLKSYCSLLNKFSNSAKD